MARGPDKKPRKLREDNSVPPVHHNGSPGKRPLPKGMVSAIRSLRHRMPEDLPQEIKDIGDRAFRVFVDVMDGTIPRGSRHDRLTAARLVRDEVCGPVPKEIKHGGAVIHVVTGIDRNPGDPVTVPAELVED